MLFRARTLAKQLINPTVPSSTAAAHITLQEPIVLNKSENCSELSYPVKHSSTVQLSRSVLQKESYDLRADLV